MNDFLGTIASRIADRLAVLDRRPAWLAKKSGLSAAQVSRMLAADSNPTIGTLASVATALEMTLPELINDETAVENISREALRTKLDKLYGPNTLELLLNFEGQIERELIYGIISGTSLPGESPEPELQEEAPPSAQKKRSGAR